MSYPSLSKDSYPRSYHILSKKKTQLASWVGVSSKKLRAIIMSYLNQWFSNGYIDENGKKQGYRNALKPAPETKTVFINDKGRPVSCACLGRRIRNAIYSYTGIPATPHTLRHIFTTHIYKEGYDRATVESFHRWMKNSPNEAKTYAHLSQNDGLVKASEAMESGLNSF